MLLRILLLPFAWLYDLVTRLRNYLYETGVFKATQPPVFSICVGNLTVGGTGKTPHVAFLIEHLVDKYKISVLSRGYGRQTSGFTLASAGTTAQQIGDEPMQYFLQYGGQITVAVGEKRTDAIEQIMAARPQTQLVILDDALQHRSLKAHLNILLTDCFRPFYDDYLIPAGRLREARVGASRADVVVVTKCSAGLSEAEKTLIESRVAAYTKPNTPVYFSTVVYQKPIAYFENTEAFDPQQPVVLMSAIAQPKHFEQAARNEFEVQDHFVFSDHHDFSTEDLTKIVRQNKPILTTEKDMVKLKPLLKTLNLTHVAMYYWPISVQFLGHQHKLPFEDWVLARIKQGFVQVEK